MKNYQQPSKQNIALITGSSRGLGFAIAQAFDRQEMATILTGRSHEQLTIALNKLTSGAHQQFIVDFNDNQSTDNFLNQLEQDNLLPDIVIHNVGGRLANDNFPLDHRVLRATMTLNLESALKINEKLLPHMVANQFGRIIHISSDASLTGNASPAYVMAKAALNGYVKSAARYYAKHNVMICGILPGVLEHEGSAWAEKKIQQPEHYLKKIMQMPLGRFGRPEEIANFVVELATSHSMMCAGGLFEFCGAV